MKQILMCCLLAALPFMLLAQTGTFTLENNLTSEVTHIFEHVNLTEATTGFLLERSLNLADVRHFDGQSLDSANLSDPTIFGKVFATLAGAEITPNQPQLVPSAYMNAARLTNKESTTIPVALLAWRYNFLDPDAVANNLFTINNGQLFDVPGRQQSPYFQATTLSVTPLIAETKNQTVTFSFPDSLFFSNIGQNILSYTLDIGNGPVSVNPNQSVTFQFAGLGEYNISFAANFSGGLSLQGHSKLKISSPSLNKFGSTADFIKTISPSVLHSGISIEIVYNKNNDCSNEPPCPDLTVPCRLIKPFIVIDGIDIDNSRGYTDFIKRIKIQPFGSDPTDPTLEDFIEDAGYDLIFLNYTDGADDLERNAKAVEEAIKQINTWKNANGSYEKNIIVGASMGGVVGKYTLLKMEAENYDYQTSRFFNLDGPMFGANIPVSFQFMIKHIVNLKAGGFKLSNFIPALEQISTVLGRPAVKQQLIYSINLNDLNDNSITNPAFSDFQTVLHHLGRSGDGKVYDCDYIVLCDGAINSSPQQYADGSDMKPLDKLLRIHLETSSPAGLGLISGGDPFSAILLALFQTFSGTHVHLDLNAWALPDNPPSDTKIYEGYIEATFYGFPVTISSCVAKVKNTRPLDSSPGGYIDWVNYIPSTPFIELFTPVICFVPTVSSLNIAPPNDVLLGDYSNETGVTESGITPITRFIGSESASNSVPGRGYNMINNFHAFIHPEIARYLIYELTGTSEIEVPELTQLKDRTYNFGDSHTPYTNTGMDQTNFVLTKTGDHLSHSLSIEGNGKIWINRNDKIAFTDEENLLNAVPSIFQVFIYGQKCVPDLPVVTVKEGGYITVGEWTSDIQNIGILNVGRSATVNIERSGTVEINDHSRVNIESGTVNVKSNGLLNLSWPDGKIIVRNGGILHVYSGGTLRVNSGAQVVVEEGGQLILDGGANIQLWDGQQPDGASTIHIQKNGKLVINGNIVFSGNGFFQFDFGNQLVVTNDLILKGYSTEHRFIRMNDAATLNISGNRLVDLSNGKIQYRQQSKIFVSEGVHSKFNNLTFQGLSSNKSVGIWCETPEYLIVSQSTASGLGTMVNLSSVTPGHQTVFSDLNITVPDGWDKSAIVLRNCSNTPSLNAVKIAGVTAGANTMGIVTEYCKFINLLNCEIHNISFGITGKGVMGLSLYNTLIDGSAIGIYNAKTALQFPMNVFLYNGTTIQNCTVGIEINGTSQSGLVMMDCAHLINNEVGIFGEDVTLQIDAYENQHCPEDIVAPNEFNLGANGLWHFNICYKHKIPGTINATGNYWEPSNPNSTQWSVTKNDYCSLSVPVNTNFPATDIALTNCATASPCDPNDPGTNEEMKACPPVSNQNIDVDPEYHKGAVALYNQNYSLAESSLSPIAQLHSNYAPTLSNKCQDYIATSYAVFDVPALPLAQGKASALITPQPGNNAISILPNPASGQFILLPHYQENIRVKVYNQLGRVIWEGEVNDKTTVYCDQWPSGIYSVVMNDSVGKVSSSGKIIITR